ncbi:MAG TPA: GNAT family N-acetyltransferase [Phycisphaerales bacterium]|nr:GNAT family N-acetyltransferase [Phycisphaerales bacterium]
MPLEYHRDGYHISTDPALIDLDVVHGYLRRSYWSPGIRREIVEAGVRNSLCYGVYDTSGERPTQVGFGRVISDYAVLAYICDVFVLEPHRGRGLSKWLVECMLAHPDLGRLRRWLLATGDAHTLYSRYGFALVPENRWMERVDSESWKETGGSGSQPVPPG